MLLVLHLADGNSSLCC